MKKINNFFEIYNRIKDIVRAIQVGVNGYDFELGEVSIGSGGNYVFVPINYMNYGEELTQYIKIPYDILETGNGIDKFIREQIKYFYCPF